MAAMREMNGLRGIKSNKVWKILSTHRNQKIFIKVQLSTNDFSLQPMDSPRSATHQAQEDPAVQSTDSIEADEMEASNVRLLCLAHIVGFPYLYIHNLHKMI